MKHDGYYLAKIIADLEFVIAHTESITKSEMEQNELLLDSILFRIIQIAENNAKLSEAYKASHPSVPWLAIKGMRNRIVHDYGVVDLTIIFDTVKNGMPEMLKRLKQQ